MTRSDSQKAAMAIAMRAATTDTIVVRRDSGRDSSVPSEPKTGGGRSRVLAGDDGSAVMRRIVPGCCGTSTGPVVLLGGSILAAMSYDLLFWKAPVVSDEDKARALTHRFLEDQTGPFEPSDDVLRFYDEVLARYPALESYSMDELRASPPVSHWSETPERSDRLVVMSFSWSVPGEVIDTITGLARKRDLVIYDPQGPHVQAPGDPDEPTPVGLKDFVWGILVGLAGALVALVAWLASVPILSGVFVVGGAFLAVMAVVTLVHDVLEVARKARA
jgi:hypothetical protein